MNHAAITEGEKNIKKIDVPADWKDAVDAPKAEKDVPAFIKDILEPCNAQQGDKIPVSTFMDRVDGHLPQGAAAYEKRGIAVEVPEWIPENCIQCNQCSLVCPHAVIRPAVMTEEEAKNAPEGMKFKKMNGKGMENYQYAMTVSTFDCTGCSNCAKVCPAKEKALVMKPIDTQVESQKGFDYGRTPFCKERAA